MKFSGLTVCLLVLLLAGCHSEEISLEAFSKNPPSPKVRTSSSPRFHQPKRLAQKNTIKHLNAPSILEEKEIQAKLAEQHLPSLPAVDLKVASRPFQSSKPVRQRLLKPLPSSTDPVTINLVEQILTFDPEEPQPVSNLRLAQATKKLLAQNSFAALDAIADTLRSKRLLNQDGEWILGYFYASLVPGSFNISRVDFSKYKAKFQYWLEQNPDSLAARYGLTQSLIGWAWEARGFGWASDVSEEGGKLFQERLTLARKALEPVKEQKSDPYLFGQRIELGVGLGSSFTEVRKDFDKAIAIEPFQVVAAYRALGYYLQPRWYGSQAEHEKFVEESITRTKSKLGQGLYLVFMEDPGAIKVDKARLLRAARDMIKRNPRSFRYRALCGELILKVEGAEAARAYYQEIIEAKTELPLSEGDRLRLHHRLEVELGTPKPTSPSVPSGQSASMLGVKLGMPQEEVEKLLGPPRQVGRYGKDHKELHYTDSKTKELYSLIISEESGRVVRMGGAGAEVAGKTLYCGMGYPEIEKLIGPPSKISLAPYQAEKNFYLHYLPLQLEIIWRESDQKAFIFQINEDHSARSPNIPVSMEEWKKYWKP